MVRPEDRDVGSNSASSRYTDAQYRFFRTLARVCAQRLGMTSEQAEDCASAFVLRLLEADTQPMDEHTADAWHFRCADNWARNFQRQLRRLVRHERPWDERGAPAVTGRNAITYTAPDGAMLREEWYWQLNAATMLLSPDQQDLFVCHYLHHEAISDIASRTGRSPHAVRQALYLVRTKLRYFLEQHGMTEVELHDYLLAMQERYPAQCSKKASQE